MEANKNFVISVSNCTTSINHHKWVKFVQCPETKKCIEELDICDRFEFDDCGDGSDENFCNGMNS